jgi:hypothetical protein
MEDGQTMPCLPESGGCERPFTDIFIEHLNRAEGASFVHRACLDVAHRDVPQPEALCEDADQELQLVIERKSISWPIDSLTDTAMITKLGKFSLMN